MAENPRVVQSGWAREHFRDLLDDAHRGVNTAIHRYQKPIAVLVSVEWFDRAQKALDNSEK